MNDIRGGRVISYLDDMQPDRYSEKDRSLGSINWSMSQEAASREIITRRDSLFIRTACL